MRVLAAENLHSDAYVELLKFDGKRVERKVRSITLEVKE